MIDQKATGPDRTTAAEPIRIELTATGAIAHVYGQQAVTVTGESGTHGWWLAKVSNIGWLTAETLIDMANVLALKCDLSGIAVITGAGRTVRAAVGVRCDWCDRYAGRVDASDSPMCMPCARMNYSGDWRAETRTLGDRARVRLAAASDASKGRSSR